MKKILLILSMFQFVANAQIVNKFRDSTWFKSGVQFDGNVVFKSGAASGKVWTSNSNGTGSWQTISTGGGVSQSALNDSIAALRSIRKVDTVYKKSTNRDLTYYKINGVEYSFKDSSGVSLSELNDSIASIYNYISNSVYIQADSSEAISYDVLNSQNAPPVSPSTGDTYLVGNSPSGAWVGHAKDIAEWNGSAWVFTDGVQGDFLYNATTALTYIFRSGNWVQTTGIPALNKGNTISTGLTIGTRNNKDFNFISNNILRGGMLANGSFKVANQGGSGNVLVGADSLGVQRKLYIGDGLSLSNDSLLATGGDSIYYFRTIAQLRTAMSAHTLKEGAKYQATDFQTIYDQPYYTALPDPEPMATPKTASTEHLVFTANSDSTFDNYVSSVEYPEDIIKFDFSFTETEVTNTPAKGRISYREDIKGNICEYDFRNILFKRYRNNGVYSSIFDNDSISGEFPTFVDYDNSLGNVMTGYVTAYLTYSLITFDFLLPNNVIFGTAIKNKFDVAYNCTFLGDCNENFFGDGCQIITSYGGCYYSYFGHGCALWTFLGSNENNYFGDGGFNVTFGARCNDNSIWDKIEEFTAGTDFKRNIQYGLLSNSSVGDTFVDAIIYGIVDSITIGNACSKIDLKSVYKVTIGNNNSNIRIGGSIPNANLWAGTVRANITIGNNNNSINFGGTKNITTLNNFTGISNVDFSGAIDGSAWANGITIPLHPELYSTYAKQIIKASNGSVYTRYFNGATDVITIIN